MIEIHKSVLVTHPRARMFALVDAVEKYPEFLPWCAGSEVLFRDACITRAAIQINYRGVKQRFSTENEKKEPEEMRIRLIEGPFKMLEGGWKFSELGDSGCKIELRLRYEFSGRILEKLIGPVFGHIAGTLIDSFVKRADAVYG
jgi:ribosome-associated toxin RatA of RatAB toxin-antitoxin module